MTTVVKSPAAKPGNTSTGCPSPHGARLTIEYAARVAPNSHGARPSRTIRSNPGAFKLLFNSAPAASSTGVGFTLRLFTIYRFLIQLAEKNHPVQRRGAACET